MASDPRYIGGIYNYCDRWCERCRFTERCMVFAMEDEMRALRDPTGRSPLPDAELSNDDPRELFPGKDKGEGTLDWDPDLPEDPDDDWDLPFLDDDDDDLDDMGLIGDEDDDPIERRIRKEKIDGHPCGTLSLEYVGIASAVAKDLTASAGPGSAALPAEQAAAYEDALEVISWYRFFIHAKLKRAVWGLFDDPLEGFEDMPHDHDGSAKIALIAIDNSIRAWQTIMRLVPGFGDRIQELIDRLDALREITEAAFPGARLFVRPGFDTEPPC